MDKYLRVETSKPEETINKNEIRVTTQGKMRRYISYATSLFQDKQCEEITLKAMGKAINKTVAIAEIIKRRIPGLHQITEIDSTDIKETYTPIEEGLDIVETTRHVSSILISLYMREPDTSAIGYQPPIPDTEVKTTPGRGTFPRRGGVGGRGGTRGGRNTGSRGRGRGRGRSRGRGRTHSDYRGGEGPSGESQGGDIQTIENVPNQPEYAPPEPAYTSAERAPPSESTYANREGEHISRGDSGLRGGRGRSRRGGRGRGRGRGGYRGARGGGLGDQEEQPPST